MQGSGKIASRASFPRLRARAGSASGFTIVEVLVVIVIIGILASTALANFIKAEEKSKKAAVIDNMHAVQVSAEAYATDTGGLYAPTASAIGPYLAGGGNTQGGRSGNFPTNPLTQKLNEMPYTETISDSATIQGARLSAPTASPGSVGQVGYNQCDAPECTSYCVTGCAEGGLRIGGADFTIVLSNH
jgi:prepilin-type N-terminal cleavage/methylation domain-containing protein